ncbi:SLAC1 anion channel family protein [Neobacillus sp. PS3-40]|uniref:SLAC1 anion channel family protein n=1 Tax=Neobacillus sp. PS3-40 TaxID=3070679 RepID=UPI0027E01E84|nr:SLAC1 anion channel family protein [Neobacillus sp. PS3-40]WML44533.1 SLAC1 anion channel family protein [Neobacillus sp. PS3-40]
MTNGFENAAIDNERKSVNVSSLQYLPVDLFGSVMGLSGLALAWRHSHHFFGTPAIIGEIIGWVAILDFLVLGIAYLIKLIRFPYKVATEFQSPIGVHFFGTIIIAILLLSIVISPYSAVLSQIFWMIGTIVSVVLAYIIVDRLLKRTQEVTHVTPPWLIGTVGTLNVAIAGGTMPFGWARELNLFTFAIGSILALVFFTLIFSRLLHHDKMPLPMTPSYMILIAPFEVGFLSYTNIIHGVDMFASILFYFGLFMFLIIFSKVFKPGFPYFPSWWAVSFPMAALSNAAFKYAVVVNTWPIKIIAALILASVTIVIIDILIRTLVKLFKGELLKA